jgi:hypothetical protein
MSRGTRHTSTKYLFAEEVDISIDFQNDKDMIPRPRLEATT